MYLTYGDSGTANTPREAILGIHMTSPTACVHIQNRKSAMTPFRIDNAAGTQICSLDNSGNLSLSATMQAPTFVASSSLLVNYATALDTVEIKNKSASTNILNGRNSSGTSVFSVDNSGNLTIGASFGLPSTVTTPGSSFLGYTFSVYQTEDKTSVGYGIVNLCSISLPPGTWCVQGLPYINSTSTATYATVALSNSRTTMDDYCF